MKTTLTILFFVFLSLLAYSEEGEFTNTIRGQVTDKQTRSPLPGASIVVLGSNNEMSVISARAFTVEESQRYAGARKESLYQTRITSASLAQPEGRYELHAPA